MVTIVFACYIHTQRCHLSHLGPHAEWQAQSYGQWCTVPAQTIQGTVCYEFRQQTILTQLLLRKDITALPNVCHIVWANNISHQPLMMETETVPEMSQNSTLTWLTAWEDLNVYCCHESFKSYIDLTLLTSVDIKIPSANTCSIFCDTI
jgi:hypothetical protein